MATPSFGPSLEALLITQQTNVVPPLHFDAGAFVITGFPDSHLIDGGQYAGLALQIKRAIAGLSKLRSSSSSNRPSPQPTGRSAIHDHTASAQEICDELLQTVKIMQNARSSEGDQGSSKCTSDLAALASLESFLIHAIRSLRSLSVLITVIDAVPAMLSEGDLSAMERALGAIADLRTALDLYRESAVLIALQAVAEARTQQVIQFSLRYIYANLPTLQADDDIAPLSQAFSIIDRHCPASVHVELCVWFARCRCVPFEQRCSDGITFAQVKQLEDCIKWIYSETSDFLLNNYHRLFPSTWQADAFIVKRFVDITLQHLTTRLADATEKQERMDLYGPLSATLDFEKFVTENVTVPIDPVTNERMFILVGVLPACFSPYLHTFIVSEQERLARAVEKILSEEKWSVTDEPLLDSNQFHFSGVDKLLQVIDRSIDRLRPVIPDQTMYLIFRQYQRAIIDYLRRTEDRIPVANTAPSAQMGRIDANTVIAIVLSAEYCVKQIQSIIPRVKITDADYSNHVAFDGVTDRLNKIRTKAANSLVLSIHSRIEPHLAAMKDSKKELLVNAGEESAYAKQIMQILKRDLPRLQKLSNYQTILSTFLNKYLPAHVSAVKKINPIPDVFAEQLLLDTERIRKFLINIPGVTPNPQQVLGLPFPPPLGEGKKSHRKKDVDDRKTVDSSSPAEVAAPVTAVDVAPSSAVVEQAIATIEQELKAPPPVESLTSIIDSHLGPLYRSLTVLAAPPVKLISVFRSQWPKRHSELLIELMDQKGLTSSAQEKLVRAWNSTLSEKSSKRVEFEQRNFVTNLFGDLRKTVQHI